MPGNFVPPQLNCQLADLRPRLSWGLVFQMISLTDSEKIKALQIRACDRGSSLSDEVGHFYYIITLVMGTKNYL